MLLTRTRQGAPTGCGEPCPPHKPHLALSMLRPRAPPADAHASVVAALVPAAATAATDTSMRHQGAARPRHAGAGRAAAAAVACSERERCGRGARAPHASAGAACPPWRTPVTADVLQPEVEAVLASIVRFGVLFAVPPVSAACSAAVRRCKPCDARWSVQRQRWRSRQAGRGRTERTRATIACKFWWWCAPRDVHYIEGHVKKERVAPGSCDRGPTSPVRAAASPASAIVPPKYPRRPSDSTTPPTAGRPPWVLAPLARPARSNQVTKISCGGACAPLPPHQSGRARAHAPRKPPQKPGCCPTTPPPRGQPAIVCVRVWSGMGARTRTHAVPGAQGPGRHQRRDSRRPPPGRDPRWHQGPRS